MSTEYVLQSTARPAQSQIDYAAALNPEQLAAVQATPGPILVIAGAGSGKTRTLTYRVAYLIDNGVEPDNILLLTFTNKAAKEMLNRVAALLPNDISQLWGGTFHHFGHRLLRRHANLLGMGQDFTIMDQDDSEDLASGVLPAAGLDPKDKQMPKGSVLLDMFGLAVNKMVPLGKIIDTQYPHFAPWVDPLAEAQRIYQKRKQTNNVVDYDDLLSLTLRLFREFPEIRERYQNQFQHILVDEYQDTSKVQADLIDTLAAVHKQVMVVGDDAQSIYSWRGANFENILRFPERYPGARTVRIETNYRSSPEILELANTAIAGNKQQFKKELRSIRPASKMPKPALICLENGRQQAEFIAQRITELYDKEGVGLEEIAVLYRSHFHAMEIQMELTRRNIPYEVTSGLRFFEQAHVKDVAAYLRLALNPKDELAFKRIAAFMPGVGKKTAEKLWQRILEGQALADVDPPAKARAMWAQWAETQKQIATPELKTDPSAQIELVVDAVYEDYLKAKYPNYQNRLEDLTQLRAFAQSFETSADFLAQLALLTNLDSGPEKQNRRNEPGEAKVRLSTVHQAKGLEWKIVFVIMLCEGMFPSARSLENTEGEEEERRLFYVAVTRAKDELYLTYPVLRELAGSGEKWQEPSRFITELPRELTNQWKIKTQKL